MKTIVTILVGIVCLAVVFAAKPAEVIDWSNGFPSGEHFNLNIHGKKEGYQCDKASGGGSVFVPEYGVSEIHILQNKRSKVSELNVIDPCGFEDPALVQLPSGEYSVYARILAKPGKDDVREVVLYPKLVDACNYVNETVDPNGEAIDCDNETLFGLGLITKDGAFKLDNATLERIAPVKGKNKAQPITDMFLWSGYACDAVYDTNGNGEIDLGDVPDMNGDLVVDKLDLQLYLDTYCISYLDEWVFNIADLVIYGWDYHNNGAKLVQVRFYPQ
jgi:hypothetical protein